MKLAVLLATLLWALAAEARVVDLHTEIRVAKSGELTVVERITVQTRGKTAGPHRDLPPGARVVEVIRNGHPEPYLLEGERLRAGPGVLPDGRHLYQLTYRCARRIAFLADHDALHWNLKGGERITAEVVLPAAVPAREIKVEASGGGQYQSFVRAGRVAFRSQGDMTIAVRFPKGVVTEPALGERARWLFSDYFGALLVVVLLGLTAGVLYLIRRRSGDA
jgi:hypothetical protein